MIPSPSRLHDELFLDKTPKRSRNADMYCVVAVQTTISKSIKYVILIIINITKLYNIVYRVPDNT